MLKIGAIEAKKGEKAFGYISIGQTVSRIPIHIPINIVRGARDGPTLALVAMIHGGEANGGMAVGKVLRDLNPQVLRGTLLAVPVANTSAYEFGQRETAWDKQDMNRVGKGRVDGSITERLAHALYHEVIRRADALVDIHAGTSVSHVWYTIYKSNVAGVSPEVVEESRRMALAFGMEQVFATSPWHGTLTEEVLREGIPAITAEVGGGADLLLHSKHQIAACARGVFNVMKLLGMLDGPIETEAPRCTLWDVHTEIYSGELSGLFQLEAQRGQRLRRGDLYGIMFDPYTGEEIGRILAPTDGTVLNTGVVWPVVRFDHWLGVLGDKIEEVALDF
jgi:predicted deacylase